MTTLVTSTKEVGGTESMLEYKLVGTSKAFTNAPVTLAQEVVVLQ